MQPIAFPLVFISACSLALSAVAGPSPDELARELKRRNDRVDQGYLSWLAKGQQRYKSQGNTRGVLLFRKEAIRFERDRTLPPDQSTRESKVMHATLLAQRQKVQETLFAQLAANRDPNAPDYNRKGLPPRPHSLLSLVAASPVPNRTSEVTTLADASPDHPGRALAVIETQGGRGSAFITRMDDRLYLLTNQHVIQGSANFTVRMQDGTELTPLGFEYSTERDLVRMPFTCATPDKLAAIPEHSGSVNPKQPVTVFGNSGGGGVVTRLEGHVVAATDDVIEVTAPFIQGNSGGPIVDAQFRLLGVSSWVQKHSANPALNAWLKDHRARTRSGGDTVYRFGFRVGKGHRWISGVHAACLDQGQQLQDLNAFQLALINLHHLSTTAKDPAAALDQIALTGLNYHDPVWMGHTKTLIRKLKANVKAGQRQPKEPYPALAEAHDTLKRAIQSSPWITGFFLHSAHQMDTIVTEAFSQ